MVGLGVRHPLAIYDQAVLVRPRFEFQVLDPCAVTQRLHFTSLRLPIIESAGHADFVCRWINEPEVNQLLSELLPVVLPQPCFC